MRWAREARLLVVGCERDVWLSRSSKSTKNYMIETIRFVRRGSSLLDSGQVLSPVSIKAADDPGATVAVEPGLHVIAHTESVERRLFIPSGHFVRIHRSSFLAG
jgi:hypothetical protein